MLNQARTRAKEKGLDFDLTVDDIFIPELCPVLGIPLIFSKTGKKGPSANSPALDRIDNKCGYVRGNVAVISTRANVLKRDAEEWELLAVAQYMRLRSMPKVGIGTNG